jgi:hypothetical protein
MHGNPHIGKGWCAGFCSLVALRRVKPSFVQPSVASLSKSMHGNTAHRQKLVCGILEQS